jgi:hypothetical protein
MPKTASAAIARRKRMWLCGMVLPLACLAHAAAQGQTAKPDAAQAAAAMERAQRIAANPMRIILEAGKQSRKAPTDDSSAAAARAAAPTVLAVAAPAQTAQRLVASASLPESLPAPAAVPVPATVPVEQVVAPLSVYNAHSRLAGPAPSASPALGQVGAAQAVTTQLSSVASPTAALTAVLTAAPMAAVVTPKLISMVEPNVPQNVLDTMGNLREVTVKFNIAADGRVSDVALQQPAPRQLARYVNVAVAQWQFEPLPEARAHSVQLVFSAQ